MTDSAVESCQLTPMTQCADIILDGGLAVLVCFRWNAAMISNRHECDGQLNTIMRSEKSEGMGLIIIQCHSISYRLCD
jgi:hypothetical protein